MKAQIKTYRTNADVWYDNEEETAYLAYSIDWDGLTFDDVAEYKEWVTDSLWPIQGAENYEEVRRALEIAMDYLRPTQQQTL